ncbi:MAG TPA: DUF2269 family protein [Gaiellaceae bacterium]|nr:DUF2269 family protein [Gaiellaceae bacterium]
MTFYDGMLFVHVAAAMIWLGGATMLQFVALRARTRGPEGMKAFARDMAWIGKNVLTPASLAVLVCGVGMVVDAWSFGDDWVVIALALFGIAFATGVGYFEPEGKRLGRAMAEGRVDEAQRRAARLTVISRLELSLLYLIVFDMFFKPTFTSYSLIAWGIGGVLVWAAIVLARAATARPAAPHGAVAPVD